MKKMYRSNTNRIISGVCAGVGEYFDIDPVVVRLVWVLIVVFTGFVPGVLAYIIAAMVMPQKPMA